MNNIISDRKIRVGLVGCGKIGNSHIHSILELNKQYELIAVCDSNSEQLHKTTALCHVKGYHDIDMMLNQQPELDLITLCSPSGLHAAQTIQIARAGKHVITEKPMATRWSDGIAMINACDQAKVQLFVVKQNRYQPALQLLKQAITAHRFGRIYLINLNVFWTRPQSYYDQSAWRGTWEFDGGAFMNQASHYVDLLTWLLGPVQSVHAMMSTLGVNIEAEDTGVLNIRWRSGALGSMNVTMLTYPKNLEASLTVLGEKGSVKLSGLATNNIEHWDFLESHEMDNKVEDIKNIDRSTEETNRHTLYYTNVAKTLKGQAIADVDGREGLRSLEILTAAYLSARDHLTINLPINAFI